MSKKRQKEEKEQKRIRVNMRLPSDLVEWVKEFADARNTNFTQVVADKLTELKAEESL